MKLKLTLFIMLVTLLFFMQGCNDIPKQSKSLTKEITFTNEGTLTVFKKDTNEAISTFNIETAQGSYETQTGLMHRKSMPLDCGMLFLFEEEKPHSFYMKNTLISLDIIYINANKEIVKIYKETTPYDATPLPSQAPIQYVLETNAGVTTNLNIEVGDTISWSLK